MYRKCRRCKDTKPTTEFPPSEEHQRPLCNECISELQDLRAARVDRRLAGPRLVDREPDGTDHWLHVFRMPDGSEWRVRVRRY